MCLIIKYASSLWGFYLTPASLQDQEHLNCVFWNFIWNILKLWVELDFIIIEKQIGDVMDMLISLFHYTHT